MTKHPVLLARRWRQVIVTCCRCYKAATLRAFGEALSVQDGTKEPHISRKEVLVKVHSAGVNYSDLLITKGAYHLKPPLPFIPGFELAGEIESVGKDVQRFAPGDRVLALKTVSTGAFAEKCAVKETELFKIPHSLNYDTASALPTAYGSAYVALNEVARATEGETILVLTSQGASGIAVIDLALSVFRCQVIVASDSEQKLQMVRPEGVLATVTYTDEKMVKHVLKYAKDGVDIIVDTVGGPWFTQALNCIKPGGRILSLSYTSGTAPMVDVQSLIKHRASVHGVSLAGLAADKPEVFHKIIETIVKFIDQQYVTPHIAVKFKLDKINDALEFIDKKSAFGKVILQIA